MFDVLFLSFDEVLRFLVFCENEEKWMLMSIDFGRVSLLLLMIDFGLM
jgi:hypothetical protein